MKAEVGVIDLTEVIELVKSAFEELAVHEEEVDAVANLDDLQGEVAVILKIPATNQCAILRMRPSG